MPMARGGGSRKSIMLATFFLPSSFPEWRGSTLLDGMSRNRTLPAAKVAKKRWVFSPEEIQQGRRKQTTTNPKQEHTSQNHAAILRGAVYGRGIICRQCVGSPA